MRQRQTIAGETASSRRASSLADQRVLRVTNQLTLLALACMAAALALGLLGYMIG